MTLKESQTKWNNKTILLLTQRKTCVAYKLGDFEWRVLKTYQRKDKEDANQYARWFTACKSPYTYDSWEYGDAYINEIMSVNPVLVDATDEWKETYE